MIATEFAENTWKWSTFLVVEECLRQNADRSLTKPDVQLTNRTGGLGRADWEAISSRIGFPPSKVFFSEEIYSTMNKKLMAVAVAGALAVPAVAMAASNVTISGRAQVTFSNVKATGATAGSASDLKSRTRVDDNSSRIRFIGKEDLGGGLSAIFRMEAGVNLDTGDASRSNTAYPASREGYVGLRGSWGQLTLGKQNVWWTNFADQTQANYINHGL